MRALGLERVAEAGDHEGMRKLSSDGMLLVLERRGAWEVDVDELVVGDVVGAEDRRGGASISRREVTLIDGAERGVEEVFEEEFWDPDRSRAGTLLSRMVCIGGASPGGE